MFVKYKTVEFYAIIIFRREKENCFKQFFTSSHVIFSGVTDRETPLRLTGRQWVGKAASVSDGDRFVGSDRLTTARVDDASDVRAAGRTTRAYALHLAHLTAVRLRCEIDIRPAAAVARGASDIYK